MEKIIKRKRSQNKGSKKDQKKNQGEVNKNENKSTDGPKQQKIAPKFQIPI
ncbi:MAG: hypothetical protein CM1200mP30_21520 [Pseudomonadota bacterium]|nr:MAG: hypothetical protein CM1200mP30_21520 [Pseudomonadota bacterium]